MSSYFTNSFLTDLRSSGTEHYPGQTVSSQQTGGVDVSCDPSMRQTLAQYGSAGVGPAYPRFPPFDRLEIRQLAGNSTGQSPGGTAYYANQASAHTGLLSHHGGMADQNCRNSPNNMQTNNHHQYSSCKLQQASGTSPSGGVTTPQSPPLSGQGIGGATVPPSPVHSPQMYNHHQSITNSAGVIPSPLYPWMRSQFGKSHFYCQFLGRYAMFYVSFKLILVYYENFYEGCSRLGFEPLLHSPALNHAFQVNLPLGLSTLYPFMHLWWGKAIKTELICKSLNL